MSKKGKNMLIKNPDVKIIRLSGLSDKELLTLSKAMTLSLNMEEMTAVQAHFKKLKREPTDIELETIAQTWSEHCKHKVFTSSVEMTIQGEKRIYKNLFKDTIRKATETVRKKMGKKDICLSVFVDNAGIIKFDKTHSVAFKVETHNHPSALDPYGGANTGIGGVIRDILGCGLGAKPLFNTDIFCFAYPDLPHSEVPQGILHPKRILKGVVAGVRDYGNRMGIPTVNGSVNFHENYLGNPLVYCGTAGMIPNNKIDKITKGGYDIISVGGRTGRDGIHGATFSSAELTTESETVSSQAVQIGNPIEEKRTLDIMLKARDKDLYINVTDCGAGGFSSAAGEIAKATGADIFLDKAPLKYAGLKPWEIFLSESQERMVFIVSPKKTAKFLKLCASEDVEATVIGKTTKLKRLRLYYKKELIGDMDMKFLHEGVPKRHAKVDYRPEIEKESPLTKSVDYGIVLKELLSEPNSASKESIIRQYDHEVGGGTFLKPLQGVKNDGPGDAAAVTPFLDKPEKTVLVSNGINVYYGLKNPYKMALSVIDEAFRQIVVSGGNPKHTAILDNFCWGNPTRDEQLASLVMAAQGCYDAAVAYSLPFISGKDSFYNEFAIGNKVISIPPTLLISAISVTDSDCLTQAYFKGNGNLVYVVGLTKNELGGSAFYRNIKKDDGIVPSVEFEQALKSYESFYTAIKGNLVESAHDCSENGLAGTIAEMAFSGERGVKVNLRAVPTEKSIKQDWQILFSESNSRFVVEVKPVNRAAFENTMKGSPCAAIGSTDNSGKLVVEGLEGTIILNENISDLKKAWTKEII